MKILRLRLQNYRRHRDVEMEFPDGVIAIVGRNGSGKTSLLEAVAFAMYGTQATRTAKALLRNDQAPPGDPLRVELDAELAGQAMTVIRELRGAQQTGVATLIVDGHTIVAPQAGSFEAVTAEITQRLGLDRDTFFTTVFAQQKDLSRLADKSKGDRKKMVLGMLGIDALDAAIAEARTLRRTSEARVHALQEQTANFADAEERVNEALQAVEAAEAEAKQAAQGWAGARQALEAATKAHAQHAENARRFTEAEARRARAAQDVAHLTQRVQDLQKRVQEADQAGHEMARHGPVAARLPALQAAYDAAVHAARDAARRGQLQQRLTALEVQLAETDVPPAPNGMLSQAQAKVKELSHVHGQRREDLAVATAQARTLKDRLRRIASVGDAPCPVCDRPMDGVGLAEHLEQELEQRQQASIHAQQTCDELALRLQAAREAEAAAVEAQKRHEQAVARRHEAERAIAMLREDLAGLAEAPAADPETIKPDLEAAKGAHATVLGLQALAKQAPVLHAQEQTLGVQMAEAQAVLADLEVALQAIPHDGPALVAAEAHLKSTTEQERQAERRCTQADQALALAKARCEQEERRLQEAQAMRASMQTANKQLQLYEALAGGRGAGLFERFRNHLVGRIGPAVAAEASHLMSRFTNGRYAEIILDDEYDIYVTDDGVRYHLDRFSGGEADLVHLALRLAVSRLLLERSGAEIRFLALDEVFGSLDDERRRLVLGALQELGTLYSQVFLVTHHEEMREMLDHTLSVQDGPDGAVVSMHNV